MPTTNSSVIAYGKILQIGNGILGAGASEVQTITFGGIPAAGAVSFNLWGLITAPISTAGGTPTAVAVQNALNAVFGTTYVNPFTVSVTGNVFTVTAGGPFANIPLPLIAVATNTSLQTVTVARTTAGQTQETFATVAGVIDFPDPNPVRDVEVYMTFDPGNQGYKSKIAKFADSGNVALTLVFNNGPQQNNITGMKQIFNSNVPYNYRTVTPTRQANSVQVVPGYSEYFTAYLTRFQRMGITADVRQTVAAGLDIDGLVQEFPPIS